MNARSSGRVIVFSSEAGEPTGMPVARLHGVETGRLALTDDETNTVAAALSVPVDLLMD